MSRSLSHRGLAGAGAWVRGPAGLAHRDSSTTIESAAERQPLALRAGSLTVVADARLDNRDELLRALGIARPAGDAELVLRAYERWGSECPRRLIGDFAFAVRDERTSSVFCARDPMGVKPFYFFLSDRLFVFASEIKALLRCPGVPNQIDEEQVARHVAAAEVDRMATLYARIFRLPAAQTLIVEAGRSSRKTYWRVDDVPDTRFATDDQYVEAFRDIFDVAVGARLRSRVPVGATLSGGLDSSSVVCVARDLPGRDASPLHTFSLVFPTHSGNDLRLIDEREYIESVVQGGGVAPHYVRGDELTPLDDARRILWHLDEPYFAPNLYLHWGMFRAARDAGVRVLLDGFDGDSVVSHGFGRLDALMHSDQWPVFEGEVRAFARTHGRTPTSVLEHYGLPYLSQLARRRALRRWVRASAELVRRFDVPRWGTAWRHGVLPFASSVVGASSSKRDRGLLHDRFAHRIAPRMERETRETDPGASPSERAVHNRGIDQPLYQLTLEMADKAARAFGVEPRYPFFDRRLIEFCVSIPDDRKFAGGWPRALFRRAMTGCLPPSVQWRNTKGNLAPNFDRGLGGTDGALPALEPAMRSPELARFVDGRRLDAAMRRYRRDPTLGWRRPDGLTLFRIAVLNEWLSGSWRDAGPDVHPEARSEVSPLSSSTDAAAGPVGDSRREPVSVDGEVELSTAPAAPPARGRPYDCAVGVTSSGG